MRIRIAENCWVNYELSESEKRPLGIPMPMSDAEQKSLAEQRDKDERKYVHDHSCFRPVEVDKVEHALGATDGFVMRLKVSRQFAEQFMVQDRGPRGSVQAAQESDQASHDLLGTVAAALNRVGLTGVPSLQARMEREALTRK
jgi:hypothetical protein